MRHSARISRDPHTASWTLPPSTTLHQASPLVPKHPTPLPQLSTTSSIPFAASRALTGRRLATDAAAGGDGHGGGALQEVAGAAIGRGQLQGHRASHCSMTKQGGQGVRWGGELSVKKGLAVGGWCIARVVMRLMWRSGLGSGTRRGVEGDVCSQSAKCSGPHLRRARCSRSAAAWWGCNPWSCQRTRGWGT